MTLFYGRRLTQPLYKGAIVRLGCWWHGWANIASVVRVADDVGAFVEGNLRVDRYVLNLDGHWNIGLCHGRGLGCKVYINCRVSTGRCDGPG